MQSSTITNPPSLTTFSDYGSAFASSTSDPFTSTSTDYPVFPNSQYIAKWFSYSSDEDGLTHLDIDLYNECYLPSRPYTYVNKRQADASSTSPTPRPTYLIDEPPCQRQAAINANCYFQNTNGTFSGLQPYEDDFDIQQQCFCDIYPFFDAVTGCNACFLEHGGIEGYHWFPSSYISAVSSSYCNSNPQTLEFYSWVSEWSQTDPAARVPSTTAPNVLGTQTAASLYYTNTETGTAAATSTSDAIQRPRFRPRWMAISAIVLSLLLIFT